MRDGFPWRLCLTSSHARWRVWAMAASQYEALIEAAFRMALLNRHPRAGLLFHSDRGSQYTSNAYQALLASVNVTVSMSRTANCYDNAVTESFFGTLKAECVEGACFECRAQARLTIFEYTFCSYNRVRRHSSLGYKSSAVEERERLPEATPEPFARRNI